jgi:hypothetical protein
MRTSARGEIKAPNTLILSLSNMSREIPITAHAMKESASWRLVIGGKPAVLILDVKLPVCKIKAVRRVSDADRYTHFFGMKR